MKLSRSFLAVSLSAAMLISTPVSGICQVQPQTVEAAVTSTCKLNKTAVTLDKGKGTQLTLSNSVSSKITWRSSNSSIATVSRTGYVKGLKAGTAYIYATYKGKNYKCTVSVREAKIISLNKTSCTGIVGEYVASLYLKNVPAKKVSWSSSNSSVASVYNGLVEAESVGTAVITARYNGKSYTCKVTVKEDPTTRLNYSAVDVKLGQPLQLKLLNVKGPVTWKSSNPKVATVSSTGKVTGKTKGFAKITATYKGKTYTCEVYVVKNFERYMGLYTITYYDSCKKCTGNGHAGQISSSGKVLKVNHTIAVDPSVIPLGSEVLIGDKVYTAEDTGAAVKGKRIEIYLGNTAAAHRQCEKLNSFKENIILMY